MACKDCFSGTLRGDVIPSGSEETLHGLDTYVTGPEPGTTPLGTVILLADAFGWKLRNTRALADAYARSVPCIVYVPDVMAGHAPPESFMNRMEYRAPPSDLLPFRVAKRTWSLLRVLPTLVAFLYHNRYAVVHPRVQAFVRAVRASPAPGVPPKVGVAGFCWGGLYAVRLTHDAPENKTSDGKPLVDCAFTAHPTWLRIPEDIEAVVRPLSVANGENDAQMGRKGMVKLCEILEAKNRETGANGPVHEAAVFGEAKHGFAVRGDRGDPLQKERGEKSEEQAVAWFRKHFVSEA